MVGASAAAAVVSGALATTAWLIERQIDGWPHWIAWRDRAHLEWVTDAAQADRYDWGVWARKQARLIAATQGIECVATEHMFIPPIPRAEVEAAKARMRQSDGGCVGGGDQ